MFPVATRFCRMALLFLLSPLGLLSPVPAQPYQVQARISQVVDEAKLAPLPHNTHPLARPEFDRGTAPPDLPMNRMLLVLKRSPEQEAALRKLLDDQQDQASPQYHRWLTPQQFGRQFGPADQDIQVVTLWLQSHGFQVAEVSKGRTVIEFSGSAGQVQEAFHSAIHKFVIRGEEHWANASDPQIPEALTPVVAGVHTLHNFRKKTQAHYSKQEFRTKPGSRPQVTFPNPSGPSIHALGPQDYATIYNINPEYQNNVTGAGTTIAVVGRSVLAIQDVFDFRSLFGIGVGVPSTIQNGPPPAGDDFGEQVEATLDVTWAGAIAPGAAVEYVTSASTNSSDGVDLSELYIVDNNLADVMTESFGSCEAAYLNLTAQATAIASLAEQAAAQGITYVVSAGDAGAEGCDDFNTETSATGPLSVNALASTPFTVAVGGTMFNEGGQDSKYWSSSSPVAETALSYIPENAWNESCSASRCGQDANILAGGGGVSVLFRKPSWQSPTLWPSLGIPNDNARDIPDVSLTAARHDPYLLCVQGSCEQNFVYLVSGTSASAPSFAGIMSLVDQNTGGRQGQADYVLYRLAAAQNYSQCNGSKGLGAGSTCVFNDVTVGNNAVPGESTYGTTGAQYQSAVAYDLATGLGSVNVANLIHSWSSAGFNATATTLTVPGGSPINIAHGASATFEVNVTSSGGTPTGDVALIANTSQLLGGQTGFAHLTLTGSAASITTNSLPGNGGSPYTLLAHYQGDSNFAPSDSAPVSVTVSPEPSTTTVSVLTATPSAAGAPTGFRPFTSGPYGSLVYLRADVAGRSGFGTPAGSVDFSDNSPLVPVLQLSLNSAGNAAGEISTLAPGQHSIIANYGGDASFNPSTSSAVGFSITKAQTTAAISWAGAPQGATLNLAVNTSSDGNPPTGNVNFFVNGTPAGTGFLSGTNSSFDPKTGALIGAHAVASFNDAQLSNGQYRVTATYAGDLNYLAPTISPANISIQPDFSMSTDLPQTSDGTLFLPVSVGSAGTFNALITALDGFNGTVAFSCSGLPAKTKCAFTPASVAANGSTVVTITTTARTSGRVIAAGNYASFLWLATPALLPAILLLGIPSRRRHRDILAITAFTMLLAVGGCGGGGSSVGGSGAGTTNPGTPTGNYNVTVTATSRTLTHAANFVLVVE